MKPRAPSAEDHISAFLADKHVLIVETGASTRTALARILRGLGARATQLHFATSYPEAVAEIHAVRPHVIITEADLGDHAGLQLIHHQRSHPPKPDTPRAQLLFVLLTADRRQAAIARAAEEEVDAYLLKPVSTAVFRSHVLQAVRAKLLPTPYLLHIQRAKALLLEGLFTEATRELKLALRSADRPTLAHAYLGQAALLQGDAKAAEAHFKAGLRLQPYHYRCLSGLIETLVLQDRGREAHEAARRFAGAYPLTAEKLELFTKLAVRTESFEEIKELGRRYEALDEHPDSLRRCLAAALIVSAKHFLRLRKPAAALPLLEKAALIARDPEVVEEGVSALLEARETGIAEQLLKNARFAGKPQWASLEFLVRSATAPKDDIIREGRRLIKRGLANATVYEIVLRHCVEAGLHRAVEALAFEAAAKWPDDKQRWHRFLELLGEKPQETPRK